MPRVLVHELPVEGKPLLLAPEDARYLLTVLRLTTGAEITVLAPGGRRFNTVLRGARKGIAELEVKEELSPIAPSPVEVVLVQGMLKGHGMDLVVQKATELGARQIVPLISERTQVRETRKLPRWTKIAQEAARQSVQPSAPEICEPVEGMEGLTAKFGGALDGYIFWEEEGGVSLLRAPVGVQSGRIYVVVGPEGGFTRSEVEAAQGAGLVVATLGERILKADTAAVVALAVVQFMCGGLGAR